MVTDLWGEWSFKDTATWFFGTGDLYLWVKSREEEIWVAHCYKNDIQEEPDGETPPPEACWGRWAFKEGVDKVRLLPVFPDKPLVVMPEHPLRLSTGTKINIFTRIPVWVRISLPADNYVLTELPTIRLSRTWFGNPLEGELCYHATTKARRSLTNVETKPFVANCSIIISNKAGGNLDFENFCYRVERLSIYRHNKELWADETEIINQGEDMNSDVIMTGNLPDGVQKNELLTPPRKRVPKSLATRTFKKIF